MSNGNDKTSKKSLKTAILDKYRKIRAAEEILNETTKEATPEIAALVKEHGPGPHRFTDGESKFWLTFRKSGDSFIIKRADDDGDDGDE